MVEMCAKWTGGAAFKLAFEWKWKMSWIPSYDLQYIHRVSKVATQNQHKSAKASNPAAIFHTDILYIWLYCTHEAWLAVLNHFRKCRLPPPFSQTTPRYAPHTPDWAATRTFHASDSMFLTLPERSTVCSSLAKPHANRTYLSVKPPVHHLKLCGNS